MGHKNAIIGQVGGAAREKLKGFGYIIGRNIETQENLIDQRPLIGYISNDPAADWRSASEVSEMWTYIRSRK